VEALVCQQIPRRLREGVEKYIDFPRRPGFRDLGTALRRQFLDDLAIQAAVDLPVLKFAQSIEIACF